MPEEPVYFAYAAGRQVGPVSLGELARMAADGRLSRGDLVWQSGTPDWVPASRLVSFEPSPDAGPPTPVTLPTPEAAPPPATPAEPLPPEEEALPEAESFPPGSIPPAPPAPAAAAPAPAPLEPPVPVPPAAAAGVPVTPVAPVPAAPASVAARRVRSLVDDLRSFSFGEIVPLSRLFDPETLGTPVSWILLLFGLGPLFLGTLVEDPLLRVRLFNFGCGALWTVFFVTAFKSERQSFRLGVAAFFATGIFGILFVSVLQTIPPLRWLYAILTPDRPFVVRLVGFVAGVGFLEELGKGLILLVLARLIGGLEEIGDGVFYGLMSGLGFGVYEAIAYTEFINPRQATALSWVLGSPSVGLYAYFVASVVRIVSLPLLHAVWTGIVGYFIGLSFAARRKTEAVLFLGFLIAATLHGLYDTFLTSSFPSLALVVAALSLLLFLSYRRSADRLLAEVRRADAIP